MAHSIPDQRYEVLKLRLAMEARASELASNIHERRSGIHVEQSADLLDNLQLAAVRDFEVSQMNRETEELSQVRRALGAMDAGSYGICIDCEEDIAPRRLAVAPWAVRCVSCQEQFEQSGDSGGSIHSGGWELGQTA